MERTSRDWVVRRQCGAGAVRRGATRVQGNANVITARRERTNAFKIIFFLFVFMWRRVVAQVAIKR